MDALEGEFERQLLALGARHGSHPRREMIDLFLLALEREELVSVGYRESSVERRLARMPLADRERELLRHALLWVWKDEQMHAIYIRGAILQVGGFRLKLQAFLHQAAGGLGGWASSVLLHAHPAQAPLARLLARLVTAAGSLLGKVPAGVRPHLDYGPFRDYCRYNVQAERTALRCWARILELAAADPGLRPELVADFRRVADDERRHERVFAILAGALDDDDRLVAGMTPERLAFALGEVGPHFLPRARRGIDPLDNPIGSGGRVWCQEGGAGEDRVEALRRLLVDCGLGARLAARAGRLGKDVASLRVVVKPTFMLGYHQADRSPVSDPGLVAALARWLGEAGVAEVTVIEGQNIYDHFYRRRGVAEVADYFGFASAHYRLVDASLDQVPHAYGRGMAQYSISRTWKEADFRISFGKLRSHPIELALLTVGNLEWVGARCDQFLFIERQASRETATMMLLDEFPAHFALLEAWAGCPDGVIGVMGAERPLAPRRFYAGADALAVDTVAAGHIGITHPRDSSLLRAACHWFGGWSGPIEVVGSDAPIAGWRGPYHKESWALLSLLAFPVYVLGSERGAVFVPDMDGDAFPPRTEDGILLRLKRRFVRRLLGLPRLPRPGARA